MLVAGGSSRGIFPNGKVFVLLEGAALLIFVFFSVYLLLFFYYQQRMNRNRTLIPSYSQQSTRFTYTRILSRNGGQTQNISTPSSIINLAIIYIGDPTIWKKTPIKERLDHTSNIEINKNS
jgi:hypothetical protein